MSEQTADSNCSPLVQVVCVTYNQKDYIREALDSFLMQKTNFKFEILVGDDCSTDGTTDIVAEYARRYPDTIRHILRKPNMGCLPNFMDLCERSTAKYVAFCDGDDFWTDENKLQKQYDFMEANEDVNVCGHKTHILAGPEWALFNHYKNKKRSLTLPTTCSVEKSLTVKDIVFSWPHTSSLFIRNKVHSYPEWSKNNGVVGDITVLFLNLGLGKLYVLDEEMSVYRRGDSGVINAQGDMKDFFLKTRLDYFRIFPNIIQYYNRNYRSFGVGALERRLLHEISNYITAIIQTDRFEVLSELRQQYPDVYNKAKGLLSEYRTRNQQVSVLGKKRADLLREKKVLRTIKPILYSIYRVRKIREQIRNMSKKIRSLVAYWFFALVPKKKNLWVFSGFFEKNYLDNTKYLYEFIIREHPEIQAIWLTKSSNVKQHLRDNHMPVYRSNSLKGMWTMARAQLAFSDHFRMSDYDCCYGFNARTRFVNLWHGVGLKDMRPRNGKLPNTTIPGVQLSDDIIASRDDTTWVKIRKAIKYIFKAPKRELFEKYFMEVCPGQQFVDYNAKPWHIPESAQFLCGYPRTSHLKESRGNPKHPKIIYAPTYRWLEKDERKLIQNFVDSVQIINDFLEEMDATFVLRLHPHTWRNYENAIQNAIAAYPRFSISKEKDVYQELADYSLMVTDYSSIAYDFLIMNKPLVFLAFDYKEYCTGDYNFQMDYKENCAGDYNFQMDYKENCAGDLTYSWTETVVSMKKSLHDLNYNAERRKRISQIFTPAEYNNEDNSERIVEELKRKLKIEK